MTNPLSTSDAPKVVMPKAKVYIKDGMRKMMTDSGFMHAPATMMRKMFGKMRGGKYSQSQ